MEGISTRDEEGIGSSQLLYWRHGAMFRSMGIPNDWHIMCWEWPILLESISPVIYWWTTEQMYISIVRAVYNYRNPANNAGMFMNYRPAEEIPFVGGDVADPIVGIHERCLYIDFQSISLDYTGLISVILPSSKRRTSPSAWWVL